ncbi:MAG: polyprenyl synthetase family protein, partial [Planctomycetota bacterium]
MTDPGVTDPGVTDPGRGGADAARWLSDARDWADALLARELDRLALGPDPSDGAASRLEDALRYAMTGGGKRVRPALCRLVGEALGAPARAIEAGAFAVECIHTYSLVHDDLPCMDDDDLRRGRPTVHRAFDEALAVLVGDALQALAFEVLAEGAFGERTGAAVGALARAAGAAGMVGGQVLDLDAEGGAAVDADGVRRIHGAKTAALLGAAAELGALGAPEAGPDAHVEARSFGTSVGLTFQALDDVLDVTGTAASLGKTPGKDRAADKATLVRELGLEGARQEAARHADAARDSAARLGLGPLGAGLVEALLGRNS